MKINPENSNNQLNFLNEIILIYNFWNHKYQDKKLGVVKPAVESQVRLYDVLYTGDKD